MQQTLTKTIMTVLTHTNVSFNFLKGSTEFLNIVLENINSCVLLLNNKMELISFNDAISTIFPRTKNTNLNYKRCGEAIGCAYQIEEATDCGKTSHCKNCELRTNAMSSYLDNTVSYKKNIIRPFYNDKNEKIYCHLQYTTRSFTFQNEKYILMLIESIHNDTK
jgi:sigma-B regulation protein RsbU (phosphoserine phosphatase)